MLFSAALKLAKLPLVCIVKQEQIYFVMRTLAAGRYKPKVIMVSNRLVRITFAVAAIVKLASNLCSIKLRLA